MSSETLQMILTLLGGLAMFIYGMNLMSDGLQKAAGERMRSILALLTRNPVFGVLAGTLCTAVLQSSSATTVMVLGFISAGLMKLPQAISIILGANIGTTITAQLIAFKIGDYAWLFVFIGFIMYFFIKKEVVKNIGQTLFAFGILFVGINVMGDTMKPLASSPVFVDLMMQVQDIPVLGVLLGTAMTVVVQSSSATIAVLQNLAATAGPDGVSSIIGLTGALPILFGDNIGTTITAVLASIGGSISAKRAAASHVIFNVTGTLIFIWFIPYYAKFIEMISPSGSEVAIIARQIANAHMCFNIANTLIFLPLIPILVKVVSRIVPGEEEEILYSQPAYIDYKVLAQPFVAIHLATKELCRIAELTIEMIVGAKQAFLKDDSKAVQKVMEIEDAVNSLEEKTVDYLSSLFSSEAVTEHQATQLSGLIHVAMDIEHIGDYCKNIVEFADEKIKQNYVFSNEACAEINALFDQAEEMVRTSVSALENGDQQLAEKIKGQETLLDKQEAFLRKQHMKRLNEKVCSPAFTVIYTDVIHNIEKIGDSCDNISTAVLNDIHLKTVEKQG